ncbi:hypothetical protein FOC42_18170 [Burkholderia cenocepacia]|uniref:hypothetical protein n=1 Tax=Burkholderia cenocepacia TaxID=95486 RepID=UPI001178A616|nr:hypothetical protein [Burkholderia cenocepacia]QKT93713.1 hypothetical protein FOC42_18170 [Burkholderia cenocepacia]UXZ93374.1 hypothetical protein NUJ27_33585 [Burkholderia cenocepacia]
MSDTKIGWDARISSIVARRFARPGAAVVEVVLPLATERRETAAGRARAGFAMKHFVTYWARVTLLKRAPHATISLFANRWHAGASRALRVQAPADSLFQVISSLRR